MQGCNGRAWGPLYLYTVINSFTENPLKMKKIIVCTMASILSFTFVPKQMEAATGSNTTVAITKSADQQKADALCARLVEIRDMDRSQMTREQKKDIRKEVKNIQQQLADISGGVYISAGALILILILLIIFL